MDCRSTTTSITARSSSATSITPRNRPSLRSSGGGGANYGLNNVENVDLPHDTLPPNVRDIAIWGNTPILAWTSLDATYKKSTGCYACCSDFGFFLLCPALWLHMVLCCPTFCTETTARANAIRSQYWILTATQLKVVNMSHDECCHAGCYKSKSTVQTIPLRDIVDCGLQTPAQCGPTLPHIFVETKTGLHDRKKIVATGTALAGHLDFIRAIWNQRDAVLEHGEVTCTQAGMETKSVLLPAPHYARTTRQQLQQEHHPHRTIEDRVLEITKLLKCAMVTQAEYDQKCRQIIDAATEPESPELSSKGKGGDAGMNTNMRYSAGGDMARRDGRLYNLDDDLPDDVYKIAICRTTVLDWTALDHASYGKVVGCYSCCDTFGFLAACPICWPYLVCMCPLLCCTCITTADSIRNQYWILTETELKIVHKNPHNACRNSLCHTSGDGVKTIALQDIVDCGVYKLYCCCCRACNVVPRIFVKTKDSINGTHWAGKTIPEVMGTGLARYEAFAQNILHQRDLVVRGDCPIGQTTMDRGDDADGGNGGENHPYTSAERMQQITKVYQSGMLTQMEYDKKRQEIIDSI